MIQNFRQEKILAIAREQGRVEVEALALQLGVTAQTIRRDLTVLCDSGVLNRVHGGAILPSGVRNIAYQERRAHLAEKKLAIADLCIQHIPDNCSLFINVGTSTEAVAHALSQHQDLLVITNNIHVGQILANISTNEVILTGGFVRQPDGALLGDATVDVIQQYKTDFAIIGTSGIDENGDLYDYDSREVRASRKIIEHARNTFLVADNSKFSRHAPVRITSLKEITALFTDDPIPAPLKAKCLEWNTDIHYSHG